VNDLVITSTNPALPEYWKLWLFLFFTIIWLLFEAWVKRDSLSYLGRIGRKTKTRTASEVPKIEGWETLCQRAAWKIEETIVTLPEVIAKEAREVPYLFRESAENEVEGYRTLGTYHNFTPGVKSEYKGPIFLYLKSIQESCAETGDNFEEKVNSTYLHELGHHFGWDEFDLAKAGLPTGRMPGEY
jgi:predicted Zn-dependent protease with MMP-like domain